MATRSFWKSNVCLAGILWYEMEVGIDKQGFMQYALIGITGYHLATTFQKGLLQALPWHRA